MDDDTNTEKWRQALDGFSGHVDGFCIAGYTEGSGLKFVHGYAGDAPCADAFKIVHYVLQDWLNPDEEE